MRPAFSSRTKRRGATALATALRLFFLTASDMWHPYGDLTRNWSALDRACDANPCHDIEWDDRRWNGCASSSLSYGAARPPAAHLQFSHAKGYFLAPVYDRFTDGFCDCGHADRASPARIAPASSVTLICWRPCARNSRWAPPSGSKPGATVPLPLIDVRVQWSTRHQDNAAQRAPMREFWLRILSNLSDALVSAQWREDWIRPAILDHDRFRQAPMPADR